MLLSPSYNGGSEKTVSNGCPLADYL
jgi:hypothetical protein